MYLKTIDEMKRTSTFFLLKPVNAIYVFIITLCMTMAVVLVWTIFAPMDDVVKATVLLRPSQAVSSVRCVTSGELFFMNYSNDDYVQKGELLFALDTTAYKKELDAYNRELEKNDEDSFINKTLLATMENSLLPNIEKDTDAFIKSAAFLSEVKRYETLLEDSKNKLEREETKPDSLRITQNIQDLQNQKEQLELEFDSWLKNQKISVMDTLRQLESSRKTIEGHISELERLIKNSTIYAPIEGKISEVRKLNIGDYVLAGEEVLKIVPQNEESLKAELYVDSSYVARVQVGNPVKIKFPGLAPSRYGMIETEVSLIPPDVTITENGQAVFIVEAVIQNPYLKEKHGGIARLLPGITAEGRIVTDRSTAMQMILRKLDFIN